MHGFESNSVIVGRLLEFTSSKEITSQFINDIIDRTIEKIKDGSVHVSQEAFNIEQMIDSKIKELALAKIQASVDYSNYQRDLKIMSCINRSSLRLATPVKMADRVKMKKNQEKSKKKKEDEQKKRNFMMKMKQWQEQKAKLLRRKKRNEEKQKSLDVSVEEQKKKEQKEEEDFLQLFKKKSIEGKIREISKRKEERSKERLHLSEVKQRPQQKHEYKYIKAKEIESIQEAKRQQQKRKILHQRSKSLELKFNQIVEHEKAFINRIKQRLKMKQPENSRILEQSSSKNKVIDSFNIHKKDPQKQKEILQKIRRMKQVQQKIQLMPLKISQQKRKEKEIMSDKLKNRKKYHFLSQKALRDSQIYQEFKIFQVNIDKKDVGNHYFQEFKQQNQRYGKGKIQSQELISINKMSSGQERQKRPKKNMILNADQLDIIAGRISNRKSFDHEEVYPGQTPNKFQQEIQKTIKTRSFHNFVNKQL